MKLAMKQIQQNAMQLRATTEALIVTIWQHENQKEWVLGNEMLPKKLVWQYQLLNDLKALDVQNL